MERDILRVIVFLPLLKFLLRAHVKPTAHVGRFPHRQQYMSISLKTEKLSYAPEELGNSSWARLVESTAGLSVVFFDMIVEGTERA